MSGQKYFGADTVKSPLSQKRALLAISAAMLIAFASVVICRVDFLGDYALQQVVKIINNQLQLDISISPLSGNPLAGLKGQSLQLLRSGDVLLSADEVRLNISLLSLLTGSPGLSKLEVIGARTDYSSLLAMLPQQSEASGPVDILINKVLINKSRIETPWGLLELDGSSLRPYSTERFDLDLRGTFSGLATRFNGLIEKKNGYWTLNTVDFKLADGIARINGAAFPTFDLTLALRAFDLKHVASIVPNLKEVASEGRFTGTLKISGSGLDFAVGGKGVLKEAVLCGVPVKLVDAGLNYSKNLIDVTVAKSSFFKSSLNGSFYLDSRGKTPLLSLDARAEGLDFGDWRGALAGSPGAGLAQQLSGKISSLEAHLQGPLDALVGSLQLAPSTLGYKNIKLTQVGGKAIFSGRALGDADFSAQWAGRTVTLAGAIGFTAAAPADLKLHVSSLSLAELAKAVDGLDKYKAAGGVNIDASLSGVFGEWVARGEISSPKITEPKYGTFENVRLVPEYHFKDGSLLLAKSSAEWNGAQMTAQGRVGLAGGVVLDLDGTLSNGRPANFEELLPVFATLGLDASLSGSWSLGGTASAPTARAEVSASEMKVRGFVVDKLDCRLSYDPGTLAVQQLDMRLGDGIAKLTAEAAFPRSARGDYLPVVWNLSGVLTNVNAAVVNGLTGMEDAFSGSVSGALTAGNGTGWLAWSFDAKGKNVSWQEFRADEAVGRIYGDSSAVWLENLKVLFLRGEHTINGKITLAGADRPLMESELDIDVTSHKLNVYELLRRHVKSVRGFQGLVKGGMKIGGTLAAPSLSGAVAIAPLRFRSFLLPMVDVKFGGNLQNIDVDLTVRLRGGDLGAQANLQLREGQWYADVKVEGVDINARQIGRYLPENFREKLDGSASFTLTGSGPANSFEGTGTFTSKEMTIFNVVINDIEAPFYISEGYAIVEDMKAKSSGGDVAGGIAFDIKNERWGGNLGVVSADIATFMGQSAPQVKGSVTGTGDFKIRVGGDVGRMSSLRASGLLQLHKGELSDFEAINAAKKFTRGNPIRYELVHASFNYEDGLLTILPGSQATAPRNDSVYQFVMLDGTVDENGMLGLFAMGKANIQALNALLGALQGLMAMDINLNEAIDKADLLQGILSGALSGFSSRDFRFVTMGIRGNIDAPRFDNIQVQSSKKEMLASIPKTASDPKDDAYSGRDRTFKFKFVIPVGPGRSGISGIENQARGQLLQNALEQLLQNTDF